MPVVKYDVSGSDPADASTRKEYPKPRPGIYTARVRSIIVEDPPDKDRRIVAELEITDGDFKGWYRKVYINLVSEAAVWKLDQFLQAFGIATEKKRKGQFNTDTLLGKLCKIQVKSSSYVPQGQTEAVYAPEISGTFNLDHEGGTSDAGEDEDDPHASDDDDEPTEPGETAEGWSKFLGMEEEELANVEDEIRPFCEQVGVDPDEFATWTEVVEVVNDKLNEGGEPEPDDEPEPEPEPEPAADDEYDDEEVWGLADLKKLCAERSLDQKGTRAKVIERLRESETTGAFGNG